MLTPTTNVALIQSLMQQHIHHEEIQWFLCRVLSSACHASFRFQCEAGKIGIWTQLQPIRAAHSLSIRILEASLDTYHSLLASNEFHVLKARPAVVLLDEMLGTIDRFRSFSPSTAQFENARIVAKALRVLSVIYASPRLVPLLEEHHPRYIHEVVDRMLLTVDMLMKKSAFAIRVWLQLCRHLLKSHEVTKQLLDSRTQSDGQWIQSVPVRWGNDALVMLDYFMILTHVFALPAHCADDLVFDPEPLLSTCLDLISKYQEKRHDERNKSDQATADLLVLEIVRLMRQWSMNAATRNHLTKERNNRTQLSTWLTTMIEQLNLPSKTPTNQQMLLELLITVQNFGSIPAFHSTLITSSKLLTLLQHMQDPKRASAAAKRTLSTLNHHHPMASTATTNMLAKDNDVKSLVVRELSKSIHLLSSPPSGCTRSSLTRATSQSDKAATSATRSLSKRTIASTAIVSSRGR